MQNVLVVSNDDFLAKHLSRAMEFNAPILSTYTKYSISAIQHAEAKEMDYILIDEVIDMTYNYTDLYKYMRFDGIETAIVTLEQIMDANPEQRVGVIACIEDCYKQEFLKRGAEHVFRKPIDYESIVEEILMNNR
ncbi:hypothetical protein H6503_04285 [Candidatus Woesearchaeota archaeon]|nr:hypothetical protein [Candidatus Woesearchaeota archaeon]